MDIANKPLTAISSTPGSLTVNQETLHLLIVFVIGLLWLGTYTFTLVPDSKGIPAFTEDDPYTSLAISKNLITHSNWGINAGEFTNASSSLLWPVLNAGLMRFFGISAIYPLVINLLFWGILLSLSFFLLRGIPILWRYISIFGVCWLSAAPSVIFGGMEHVLHTVGVIALVYWTLKKNEASREYLDFVVLFLLAVVAASLRYETGFVIASLTSILLSEKRFSRALVLCVGAGLPILLWGLYSISNGQGFFPDSVVLRAGGFGIKSIVARLRQVPLTIILYSSLSLAVWTALKFGSQRKTEGLVNANRWFIVFFLACVLHCCFARFGWLWRYEFYLFWLGLIPTAPLVYEFVSRTVNRSQLRPLGNKVAVSILVLFGLAWYSLMFRDVVGAWSPEWVHAMSERKVNITMVQADYMRYLGERWKFALDDIGAPSFYADGSITDLYGLANHEWAETKRTKKITESDLLDYCKERQASIAMVYDGNWKSVPSSWQLYMVVNFPARYNKPKLMVYYLGSSSSELTNIVLKSREFEVEEQKVRPEVNVEILE